MHVPAPFFQPTRRVVLRGATALLAVLLVPSLAYSQAAAQKPNRLALQVSDNDPAKWGLALNNAYNVQQDLGAETTEIEIVVYGPGISMLKAGSPVAARVASAMKSGIKVVACENTMTAQKLAVADMLPDLAYVPAGVSQLMKRQQQGWAYIRP
jgi:intracellular sulfur oxidation DsrE/DsrF family protein